MIELGLFIIWASSFLLGYKGYSLRTLQFWVYIVTAIVALLGFYRGGVQ